MTVLSRTIVKRLLLIIFYSCLIAATMIVAVDLFRNLETYSQHSVGGYDRLILTLLAYPQALMYAIGPCCLFSTTFFLSMMHADNEIIAILNAGISYRKVLRPFIVTALVLSVFCFVFNETVAINCMNEKDSRLAHLTEAGETDRDNRSIAMSDYEKGIVVYAQQYVDRSRTLYSVSLICKDKDTTTRYDAYKAVWNHAEGCWTLSDVYSYTLDENGMFVSIENLAELSDRRFSIEPELFRNMSDEVSRMDLDLALNYVLRMKNLDPVQYAQSATDLAKRVLSCLTPLVMILIATGMNYRFKKNILFISIICSLCIAVVYYVVGMITNMMASQGLIMPIAGPLLPLLFIIIASRLEVLI